MNNVLALQSLEIESLEAEAECVVCLSWYSSGLGIDEGSDKA
ncbi:hypothetical protein ACK1O1_10565 [Stenotrophomonas maltophilia]|jgi:hypothetical protein|uniref:Uncharacterized protein n=1 Tax=Stenotrophomonas maltophilia (strain R551-3) TaxID=391008 RepID=B4SKB7_STRM5|nr:MULTISPECIES: hypothetical protein [Stenotrophomonas]ACF51835.1 hypothetical protein Smal_2131 [Stenotrophomonas maltophilia R551-3]MDH1272262.1 hypothetical protein [Stenotrophomonas sp. GD03937]MDH1483428.1 hypothetical protein [Stenotrophomonas sp. GD03712]WON66808.1 hypothetical protein RWT08_11300 [Stenotrophomonas maltophilia]